jgi:spermidine synthase
MVHEKTQSTVASLTAPVAVVYLLSLILSACSLLYELLIAQTLSLIAGNMVIWYSLTVGTYLAAMGAGAILYGSPSQSRDWGRLYRVEIMLSLIGASAVILLNLAHTLYFFLEAAPASEILGTFVFFGFSFVLIFLIGILTGMELPLLIHLGNEAAAGRNVTNRVLGWDYIGALAGGVLFPLYMVPFLELHTIGFIIAGLNLTVAIYILRRFLSRAPGATLKTLGSAAFGAVLIFAYFSGPQIEQFFLKKYYFASVSTLSLGNLFDPMLDIPSVFRESSPYQKIDIVHVPDLTEDITQAYSTKFNEEDFIPDNRFLFLNGDFQFASNYEELYHEWFAHVPIIINGKVPERVLVLGGGDGLIHRELLKYKGIKSIVHVDIDHRLVALAKSHPVLVALNKRSLHNPRVRTIFGDAFQYLRSHVNETYDAIYMDFPDVKDYNLSKLYSREFFHFVKKRLADDGFAALDTPGVRFGVPDDAGLTSPEHYGDWEILSNTMRLAGFKTILPFYSILEVDNPEAYEMLTIPEDRVDPEEGQEEGITEYLTEFSDNMQQGFMMLRKDERVGPFEYVDFGIQLYVLNEKRFKLSHPDPPKPTGQVDLRAVNSILRPTLPDGMMWNIRTAW